MMTEWILAWLDVNYQTAYWESVAYNEWWLQLLLDLQQQQEQ
jgi:hypothetical protein